jgi:regulatory subunit for Cdc7p protein kinase
VHELKRKVLEKNAAPAANGAIPARRDLVSHTKNERLTTNFRVAKRRAQEKLGFVDEDFTPSEEEENVRQREAIKKARSLPKREPKPGYCENCREKFDDFDEV